VPLYIDFAYFPFFRFMSENSLMVKISAKPIKENTTTPVKNKTWSVIDFPPDHHELEVDAETQNGWHPDRREESLQSLPVKPQITRYKKGKHHA